MVSFAVVGCGHIGPRHSRHIASMAELAYVCDVKEDRAKQLAEEYGCGYVTDYRMLLDKDFDVANICTPNGTHAQLAIDFLEAGKHVVCEKPMCLKVEDGERMMEAAEKAGKHLFIVKQNRYNPPVKAAREVLESGELGELFMCAVNCYWNRRRDYYEQSDWKGSEDLDGGALYTQFSHFIDLMILLMGPVESVDARSANYTHPYIGIDDTGVVLVKFKNGGLGAVNYTNSVYDQNYEGSITLFGSAGTVKIGGQYLNTLEHWNVKGVPKPVLEDGNPPNDYGTYKGSMSNHDKVIENVVEVLSGDGEIHTTAAEGLETVKLINAAYKSAESGGEVRV